MLIYSIVGISILFSVAAAFTLVRTNTVFGAVAGYGLFASAQIWSCTALIVRVLQ